MHTLDHRHLIVTAFLNNAPTSVEKGQEWLTDLVNLVDMQILMDAKAIYCEDLGNEGLTGVVGLTTSHSSFHAWHTIDQPFMNFDLYSCKDFSVESVLGHFKQFSPSVITYMLIDRNGGMNRVVDAGVMQYSEANPEGILRR
jgi:S-adenosylmethionine/arginine decarboxylase-like enzyme